MRRSFLVLLVLITCGERVSAPTPPGSLVTPTPMPMPSISIECVGLSGLARTKCDLLRAEEEQQAKGRADRANGALTRTYSPRASAIPWVDLPPAPTPAPPTPTPEPPEPAGVPGCRASQLEMAVGGQGAGGSFYGGLGFANRGSAACALKGVPYIELLDASGRSLEVKTSSLPNPGLRARLVVLEPGSLDFSWTKPWFDGAATLMFSWHNYCGATGADRLRMRLPDAGGTLEVAFVGRPRCDSAGSSTLGIGPFEPRRRDPPVRAGPPFAVSAEVPGLAVAGEPFEFQIILTNASAETFRFATCPNYRMRIGTGANAERHRLACDGVVIAPGESVAFAMRVAVPAELPVGLEYELWWGFEGPDAPIRPVKLPLGIAGLP